MLDSPNENQRPGKEAAYCLGCWHEMMLANEEAENEPSSREIKPEHTEKQSQMRENIKNNTTMFAAKKLVPTV